MKTIREGEIIKVQGSAAQPYEIKRIGEVISCSCPAWRNQSLPINKRTCKHIRQICGDQEEEARISRPLTIEAATNGKVTAATAPALLLAEKWTMDQDPTGWWISEKLDGVRALWNGKEFISRLGNKFYAPEWFIKGMPKMKLDGELWIGRGKFQEAVSIVRTQGTDKGWDKITYRVFDVPGTKGPFEYRMTILQNMAAKLPAHCEVVKQTKCESAKHLKTMLDRYTKDGAEGLMLRQPGSEYVGQRSSTLLKVKTFHDQEATITGYEPGKGRHAGRLGAYFCTLKSSKTFSVGSGLTDQDRDKPLPVGTKITVRYQELSNDGIPRFPVYVGEAIDK